jgi:hypothetical protein
MVTRTDVLVGATGCQATDTSSLGRLMLGAMTGPLHARELRLV